MQRLQMKEVWLKAIKTLYTWQKTNLFRKFHVADAFFRLWSIDTESGMAKSSVHLVTEPGELVVRSLK